MFHNFCIWRFQTSALLAFKCEVKLFTNLRNFPNSKLCHISKSAPLPLQKPDLPQNTISHHVPDILQNALSRRIPHTLPNLHTSLLIFDQFLWFCVIRWRTLLATLCLQLGARQQPYFCLLYFFVLVYYWCMFIACWFHVMDLRSFLLSCLSLVIICGLELRPWFFDSVFIETAGNTSALPPKK